ncbi:hypothetical protein ebA2594 [Aromatoleum aromaticum EbN1]|uniref:Ferric oxidoreductase domain-containing protein n=1 Tax=Aromatoleum aromaticum (strain DSM 19018 / LMG 30748 / EbN1) TaxID=76114 RepID=Q5P530_AROAE|nr:ferric reductase-like transmembrane domain-containing protein [Aromatoleum aromaticum]CAI07582.1 hypothetical protein ebA2594 [Aromatoleum aromaticum EbN1]
MKNIRIAWAGLIAVLSLLWWMADPLLPQGYEYFALRTVVINYTGIIGIGVMSVGMMLALRSVRLEPLLGGMDKAYRLHKWLGITGLGVSIIHWLWAQGTKWAAREGRLDVARICTTVPEWASADIWFCGPGGFGQALREGFTAKGLSPGDFHQELFAMR